MEESRLINTNDSLEKKCAKLRDYIRKLTLKCEEWEASYQRQSKAIEKLQANNLRIRQKATEMASRYRKLSGDIQRKTKVNFFTCKVTF